MTKIGIVETDLNIAVSATEHMQVLTEDFTLTDTKMKNSRTHGNSRK